MMSTLTVLAITPFVHKISEWFSFLIIFIATMHYYLTHPFTQMALMKVQFPQQVYFRKQLDPPPTKQAFSSELTTLPGFHLKDEVQVSVTTLLISFSEYIKKAVSELPSSHSKDVWCEKIRTGLTNYI